jgi:excisionase family DNA binding protein
MVEERPKRPMLSVEQVAERLQVSKPTVRRLAERKELQSKRVGSQLRFELQWVEEFIVAR